MSYLDIFDTPQPTQPTQPTTKKRPDISYENVIVPILNDVNPSNLPEQKPKNVIVEEQKNKNNVTYTTNNDKVETYTYTQLPENILNYFPELTNIPPYEQLKTPDYTLYYILAGIILLFLLYK